MSKIYDSEDLQSMLIHLKKHDSDNSKLVSLINSQVHDAGDRSALLSIIRAADAERFDRYDSEISESFIILSEQVFGEGWNERKEESWKAII